MGISLYYEARRGRPLSTEERTMIDAALARYPVEGLISAESLPAEEYNGEAFGVYSPGADTEPGVVFEGATKLPTSSEEVFWAALMYWCQLLSEVRRVLPDAQWAAHLDDHDIWWDPERQEYDPSV